MSFLLGFGYFSCLLVALEFYVVEWNMLRMRSGQINILHGEMMMQKVAPSLVELCIRTAIDNVRYLGDVGETDIDLLGQILPHCTVDQLMHIENSTKDRDLSPVTDKLWKKFYELQFGAKNTSLVVDRMKQKRVTFKWKDLYEAKQKDVDEAQQKSIDRFKQRFKKEEDRKQSRQVQLCTKVPPGSKRSFFGGGPGNNFSNVKSNIMKKAKMQVVNSREVQNLAAMRKSALQRGYSVSPMKKPSGFPNNSLASTSKSTKPMERRLSFQQQTEEHYTGTEIQLF
ncbi:LOW QUALITY PROTEIN: RNA polymerase II transcription factor SIII, subunit A [Dillenia turbinata]|uniref:RNA polymerase II transcription factor SIII, subunit A n=1 Tax=Dillenia turbinata TaxID=194707 RepID=A0AAN8YYU1_9MAGN